MKIASPKICLTASGCLIWQNKILLVKHKKARIWLKPGGHVEPGEVPHQTAEREFFEETGIEVRASKFGLFPNIKIESEFLPVPFAANLHWVSEENYQVRTGKKKEHLADNLWRRGCEQHCNYDYFVEPVNSKQVLFTENSDEIDGIAWFRPDQLDDLETTEDVRSEVKYAFTLLQGHHGKSITDP